MSGIDADVTPAPAPPPPPPPPAPPPAAAAADDADADEADEEDDDAENGLGTDDAPLLPLLLTECGVDGVGPESPDDDPALLAHTMPVLRSDRNDAVDEVA